MTRDPRTDGRSVPGFLKLLPTKLYVFVRTIFMALVTPTANAARRGYFRSALTRSIKATGRRADTVDDVPPISFESRSFAGRTVLEFGSGASTEWWAERADQAVALETDVGWLEKVRAGAPENVDVLEFAETHESQEAFDSHVHSLIGDRRFSVVVVDGGDRVKALHVAPELLEADGVLIVDDLDLLLDPQRESGTRRLG